MMNWKSTLLVAGVVASAWSGAIPLNYAGRRDPIDVGVLVVPSQQVLGGEPQNFAPHVWGQLEKDRTIKPAAWSFQNPRGLSLLTDNARNRWLNLGASGVPTTGTRLTKDDAPYWEVNLAQVSEEQLADYDALLLPVSGTIRLNPVEREKLRRFVDAGGLLWVDLVTQGTGSAIDLSQFSPLPFAVTELIGAPGNSSIVSQHPLLNSPVALTGGEIRQALLNPPAQFGTPASTPPTQAWLLADNQRIEPIVYENPDAFSLGLGRLGDGYVLFSASGLASALNEGLLPSGATNLNQNRFRSLPPTFSTRFRAAAKVAVNALSLRGNFNTTGAGSRKGGGIGIDLSAPLLRRFDTTNFVPRAGTSPIFFEGQIIMVTTSNELVGLDAEPTRDLNGDGNPDDGVIDPQGSEVDVLWRTGPLGFDAVSTPTGVDAGGFGVVDRRPTVLIYGVDDNSPGQVLQYPLDNFSTSVAPLRTYVAPSATRLQGITTMPEVRAPSAPTVHEGLAYITDIPAANNGQGRVWAINLMTGQVMRTNGNAWRIELTPRMAAVDGAATVGYIPILDNSGGMDKVVYVPTQPDGARSAGFVSIWAGTRGEAPVSVQVQGNALVITTRAALQNLPIYNPPVGLLQSYGVKLSVIDPATGRAFDDSFPGFFGNILVNNGQNGTIRVELTGSGQSRQWTGPTPDAVIRVDYTLDWGQASGGTGAVADNFIRGDVQLPDGASNSRRVIGNIALAPNGNLFVVTAPLNPTERGGSLFAMRERGRGDFAMLYRWEAFEQLTIQATGSSGVQNIRIDGSIIDYDGLLNLGFGSILNRPIVNLRFATGPVLYGDTVLAALTSSKLLPFPGATSDRYTTTVMAFEANPRPLELIAPQLGQNFAILQPDPGRSVLPPINTEFVPNTLSVLQPLSFQAEEVDGFTRVTLNTVASVSRGRFRDALISNMPLIVRRQNTPDIVIQPDLGTEDGLFVPGNADGRWNPQRWQVVVNGLDATGNLFVSGNTLFFGGGSLLPGILDLGGTGFPSFTTKQGLLYAMDLRISPTDLREPSVRQSWMRATIRPWERYISTLDVDAAGQITPSRYILWPSAFGIRSFDDLRVRLRQALLGNPGASPAMTGLVGGNGALIAWDAGNAFAFGRSDLFVVDEGRLLRVDPLGFPIWSTEFTRSSGREGQVEASGRELRLGRPTRIRPQGRNYWVADPGRNRLALIDTNGQELRSIEQIALDPLFLPDGVTVSTNRRLSGPSDLVTFNTFRSAAEINALVANGQLSPAFQRDLPGTAEYWVHYIIADTGNFRVIELVDRYTYDPSTGTIGNVIRVNDPASDAPLQTIAGNPVRLIPALGQLRWQIRSELTRKNYAFNSIDRIFVPAAGGGVRQRFIFGFGNIEPGRASFGLDNSGPQEDNPLGAGGVVLYDPETGATDVITGFAIPAIGSNVFWNNVTSSFNSPARAAGFQRINGLRSATIGFSGGRLAVMIADNNGVYELVQQGGGWIAVWAMPREAYLVLRRTRRIAGPELPTTKNPMDFIPTFARRLNSGEVLIVNGYVGSHRVASLPHISTFGIDPGDPFGGEVVILSGAINAAPNVRGFDWNKPNLGLDSFYVNFELPPVTGTRSLQGPVFADKR